MIIAHLPAGYILARAAGTKSLALGAVLLASVLPDFDMLWFHLVDGRSVHHHRYWVHAPGFWLGAAMVVLPAVAIFKRQWLTITTLCFSAILMHHVLDTLVGSVMWRWPFSTEFFQLAEVQPTHSHWVLSFMFHWSFLVELLICSVAGVLFLQRKAQP